MNVSTEKTTTNGLPTFKLRLSSRLGGTVFNNQLTQHQENNMSAND